MTGTCLIAIGVYYTGKGEWATVTLQSGMRSRYAMDGNELGNRELPSASKVAVGSGIRNSHLFEVTMLYPPKSFDFPRELSMNYSFYGCYSTSTVLLNFSCCLLHT